MIAIWPEDNLSRAVYYRTLGRTNAARVYHERLERDPKPDLYKLQHLALGEVVWRHYDEAIRIANRMIELFPNAPAFGQFNLGRSLLAADRYPEAMDAFLKAERDWEGPETDGILGRTYALMGDRTEALERLQRLEPRERSGDADPYYLAWIYEALACLSKAIDYRSEYITGPDYGGLRTAQAWDGLRNDPGFEAICRRVGMGKGQWPK